MSTKTDMSTHDQYVLWHLVVVRMRRYGYTSFRQSRSRLIIDVDVAIHSIILLSASRRRYKI